MILVIDNYDSFVYNLVQYVGELTGGEIDIRVIRNDAATPQQLLADRPSHIIISPGPCTPTEAGISLELIRSVPESIPLLGVCLGHQAIAQAFGGEIVRASNVMHGKTSLVRHDDRSVHAGLPNPFEATRYHSLIVRRESLPDELTVTAWTEDGTIMGLEHRSRPLYGVQYHPESLATEQGKRLVGNFLQLSGVTS